MRVGIDYEERKKNAIQDYERYVSVRGDFDDRVELSGLEQIVKNLIDDRFSLAVAGEVSSGKSTFINALLGEDVLPTDVLQNTCAVVEIVKSHEKYLDVTFAKVENGRRKQEHYRDDVALIQLRKVAAVPEKYRHIPFTLINSFLVDGNFDPPMDELEQRSKMPMKGKDELVRQYIEEFRDLSRIPLEVKLGYPLKNMVTDICIVDTPGVSAIGSIQDKTLAYINTANAILFVHPIKPVEAESFRTFLRENVTERSKEALFLILSHASLFTQRDVESALDAAKQIHHELDPRRIIAVDSKLRLIEFDLQRKTVEEVMEDESKGDLLAKYYRKTTKKDELLPLITTASNFSTVEDMVEELTADAPNLPIRDIYQRLERGYCNQRDTIQNEIKLTEAKKQSPRDFERKISDIRDKISAYKVQVHHLGHGLRDNYLGVHGEGKRTGDQMKNDFGKRIEVSSSDGEVKKHLLDFIQASGKQAFESVVAQLIEECDQRMRKIGGEFKKQTDFSMPSVDVDALMRRASANAYDTHKVKIRDDTPGKEIVGGVAGGIIGGIIGFLVAGPPGAVIGAGLGGGGGSVAGRTMAEGPVYEPKKTFNQVTYLSNLKQEIRAKIWMACDADIPMLMNELIEGFITEFGQAVEENCQKEEERLKQLIHEQKTNEELIEKIRELSSRLETVKRELRNIVEARANVR